VPDRVATGAATAAAALPAAVIVTDAEAEDRMDDAADGEMVVVTAVEDGTEESVELAVAELELEDELESDEEEELDDDDVRARLESASVFASMNAIVGPAMTLTVARTLTFKSRDC